MLLLIMPHPINYHEYCFESLNSRIPLLTFFFVSAVSDAVCAVVSVMALGSKTDENKQVTEVCESTNDNQHEDGSSAVDEDLSDIDHPDSVSYKRRSLKGKPRIPSAVDTSRLNKHLTNIWSSKRKKATKKQPSSVSTDTLLSSDLQIDSAMELAEQMAADESTAFNSQASTVIIVKTLAQKEDENDLSPVTQVSKLSGDRGDRYGVEKGSHDIAERLKARRERFKVSLGSASIDTGVGDDGKVTCELCAETVADYMQLVSHVCEQHEDCTYVRNYLDEIQPIADALAAVSLPCTACGRTFAGQAALSAHRHECTAVDHTSKLGAQRKRVAAGLLSPSEHGKGPVAVSGTQQNKAKAARKTTKVDREAGAIPGRQDDNRCVHCKRKFSSPDNLAKHVLRVHTQKELKPSKSGRQLKSSTSLKLAAAYGSGLQPPAAMSTQLSVSGGTDSSASKQFQRCDHCNAGFSRTSLLVTHMRYCLKADTNG